MKRITLFIAFLIIATIGSGQENERTDVKFRNSVYFELGGNGVLYSLNFERFLSNEDALIQYNLRGGLEYINGGLFTFDGGGESTWGVPIELGGLIRMGESGANYYELGAGLSSFFTDNLRYSIDQGTDFMGTLRFGYRHVSEDGFLFKIAVVPLVYEDGVFPWLGVGVGGSF